MGTGEKNGGGGQIDDDDDDDDAMEMDSTDLEMGGGQQTEQQRALFSKVMSSPIMASMGNEGAGGMSAYISELLKSTTTGTTDEDIAETERKFRKAEDELDEIRRKMGWYF